MVRLIPASILYLGWFGPRGLASIVLGLIFLEREVNLKVEQGIILAVATTVLLSILVHGVSALPGTKWYARRLEHLDENSFELQEVTAIKPG